MPIERRRGAVTYERIIIPERDAISACTDEAVLNGWHREAYDLFDDLQSKIEAYQHAGTADEDWTRRASGKVARCKSAIRQIERRMAELRFDLPCTRDGREREMIRDLRAKVRSLEGELRGFREGPPQ
jgi:hypothetical protein